MSRNPVIKNKIFFIHFSLARISVLAPNSPTLYTLSGIPAHHYFLWPGPGRGTGPVCPNASPATVDHGLPIRLCQTPLPLLLTLDRFPGSPRHGYPAGSDSPAIRRSILLNKRFVRWLSANSSQ